ncbi:MAG: hypothetical protein LBD02_04460 [Christensenellaceae bacterium]|jgi:hypothetical protein|nr:hypothetical protein [Christensenellaceae bacterium]
MEQIHWTNVVTMLTGIAGIITAIGIIFAATKRGRDWLIHPALDLSHANRLLLRRLEFLLTVNTQPEKAEVIEKVYAEYKGMGGNGYVDGVYNAWKKGYEESLIRERIKANGSARDD